MLSKTFDLLLSERTKKRFERITLTVALLGFFIHLLLIYLLKTRVIDLGGQSELFKNPISAIYTPFSFILVYEVYLLIYYLPKSFTNYISKQYEIITLIIIRKLFKDLAGVELSTNWFKNASDVQFTYDILASLLLFYLIYLFQKHATRKMGLHDATDPEIDRFIVRKKLIAVALVPVIGVLACTTFVQWAASLFVSGGDVLGIKTINHLFFDEFFTILILVDVVLLLLSFFYTDQFHKIIRNTGFVVSTILIRLSLGATGLVSTVLVVMAVLFGLLIVLIHNQYEKKTVL
ncbi:MAG: hypothetical protein ACO3GN_08435 [Bacteroidia bacterium]